MLIKLNMKKLLKPETKPEKGEIKMGEVVKHDFRSYKRRSNYCYRCGQHQMYAARYYKFTITK